MRTAIRSCLAAAALGLGSCGGSTEQARPATAAPQASPQPEPAPSSGGQAAAALPPDTSPTADAPEISRSRGAPGGVVVLWPRISPRDSQPRMRELAARVQQRIRQVVAQALPGRPVDVRPEPERVCPRDGCAGVSVGAMLTSQGPACAVAALVSGPGEAPARIVPWAALMTVRGGDVVPFREAPEARVAIGDYVDCATLLEQMSPRDGDVAAAVRIAAGAQ